MGNLCSCHENMHFFFFLRLFPFQGCHSHSPFSILTYSLYLLLWHYSTTCMSSFTCTKPAKGLLCFDSFSILFFSFCPQSSLLDYQPWIMLLRAIWMSLCCSSQIPHRSGQAYLIAHKRCWVDGHSWTKSHPEGSWGLMVELKFHGEKNKHWEGKKCKNVFCVQEASCNLVPLSRFLNS